MLPPSGNEDDWRDWHRVGDEVLHIELRRWADVIVVAPLSANSLAKLAGGLCDNLLTCVLRAWDFSRPALVRLPLARILHAAAEHKLRRSPHACSTPQAINAQHRLATTNGPCLATGGVNGVWWCQCRQQDTLPSELGVPGVWCRSRQP